MAKLEFKGTKGEWGWQKFGNKHCLVAQHGLREIIIGANTVNPNEGYIDCYPSMNNDGILKQVDPRHPNAKLIAAAPELLEALLSMRIVLNGFKRLDKTTIGYKAQEKAFKAINKAL